MSWDFSRIEASLNDLRGKDYISEESVEFFGKIFKAQDQIISQLNKKNYVCALTAEEAAGKLQEGQPLISLVDVPLDPTLLNQLFENICEVLNTREDTGSNAVQKLQDAHRAGKLDLTRLVEKFHDHDAPQLETIAEETGVGMDVLIFMALSLAKPFFEVVAQKVQDLIDDEKWLKNTCPVCGGSAQISRLHKDEGKRYLYCTLCSSQWRYMRLQCTSCAENLSGGAKYLSDENSPYRIDLCEKCKRYIKTFDEKQSAGSSSDFIPAVEDIATMYLDMLASKEGYERSWFFPAPGGELKTSGGKTALQ